MEDLSEEEINEFREIFNLVDKDGGGRYACYICMT